jgi:hypothetical protein
MLHEEFELLELLGEGEQKLWTVINTLASRPGFCAPGDLRERTKKTSALISRLIFEKKIIRSQKTGTLRLHGGIGVRPWTIK